MANCLRTGCTGEIDGGYCDVCGNPPLASTPVSAVTPASAVSPAVHPRRAPRRATQAQSPVCASTARARGSSKTATATSAATPPRRRRQRREVRQAVRDQAVRGQEATGARPPSGRRHRSVDRPLRTPTRSEQLRARERRRDVRAVRVASAGARGELWAPGSSRCHRYRGAIHVRCCSKIPRSPSASASAPAAAMRSAAAAKADPVGPRVSAPRTVRRSRSRRSSGKATWSPGNTAWPDASRTVGSAGSIWPRT